METEDRLLHGGSARDKGVQPVTDPEDIKLQFGNDKLKDENSQLAGSESPVADAVNLASKLLKEDD